MKKVVHFIPVGHTKITLTEGMRQFPVHKIVLILGKEKGAGEEKARKIADEIIQEFKPMGEAEILSVDLDDIYSTALLLTQAIKKEQLEGNQVMVNASGSLRTAGISCYISSAITGADMYIAIPYYENGTIAGVKEVIDIPRFPLKRFGKTEHKILNLLLKKGSVKSLDSLIRDLKGEEIKKSSYLKERAKISYHINKLKKEEMIEAVREGKNIRIGLTRFGEIYAASISL